MFIFQKKIDSINETFNNINENECKKISKTILNFETNSKIIEPHVYNNLEIFTDYSQNENNSIISKIIKTHSITGRLYFEHKLLNPIDDINYLQEQKNEILNVINNGNIDSLNTNLNSLKSLEKDVLSFTSHFKSFDDTIDSVLINAPYLNFLNNKAFLNFYNNYNIFSPIYNILSPVLLFILPYIITKIVSKINIDFVKYTHFLKFAVLGIPGVSFSLKTDIMSLSKTLFTVFIYVYSVYNSISFSLICNTILKNIHNKLINLKKYLQIIQNLQKEYSNLIKINTHKLTYSLLNKDIYNSDYKLLSNKGELILDYLYIKKHSFNIEKSLTIFSKLDYIHSIISLIDNNNYCLVNYLKLKKPGIFIKNFHHPNITKSVKNTIEIGFKNLNNVLITGPNAGGKSTLIKTISLSLLMSQTLGIAPASKVYITPFNYINTYLNIYDIKGKHSLFESEMKRMYEHIDKLKSLGNNKFSFIIIDELFSGTNPTEAIASSFSVANQLGNYNNSISIITTHFDYLTNLKKFKNYKMKIEKDTDNNEFIFTYKLKSGISKDYVAIDLLEKNKFGSEIIENAKNIKKILNDNY